METITAERELSVMENLNSFYESRYNKFFLQVARFVSKRGGVLEDTKDLYHDALVLYYEKLLQPGFALNTSEEAYIMGIIKNLWSRKLKDELKKDPLTYETDFEATSRFDIDHNRLYNVVRASGKKCLDLLTKFYTNQCSLKDLATALGFSSEHSAAVQKYKCLEKIREVVRQNSISHEDFFE